MTAAGFETSDIAPVSSKEFLNSQATIECRFTLKRVRDMLITYSQMNRTDKYSQHSSIIWPVWLNGGVFDYELSGCGFELSYLDLFEIISSFWLVAKIIRWKRSKSIFSFFLTKYNFYFQQRSSNNYLNSTHMFQWIFSILSNLSPFLH